MTAAKPPAPDRQWHVAHRATGEPTGEPLSEQEAKTLAAHLNERTGRDWYDARPAGEPKPAPEVGGVVHLSPRDATYVTPCCGKTPFDLPRTDRMTNDPALATCRDADRHAAPELAGESTATPGRPEIDVNDLPVTPAAAALYRLCSAWTREEFRMPWMLGEKDPRAAAIQECSAALRHLVNSLRRDGEL